MTANKKFVLTYIGIAAIFGILPTIISSYGVTLLTLIAAYSIFAMSYNLLLGYTGLVSFGHALFWGIGAYTAGIFLTKGLVGSFPILLLITMGIALISGVVLGFLVTRTVGVAFTFINLALAELFSTAAFKLRWLTNGEDGLSGIIFPWGMSEVSFYYVVFVIFLICLAGTGWLVHSQFGLSLQGIRENEARMAALGYNTWLIKYVCYIIAGMIGAIAGFLGCYSIGIVSPEFFSLHVTALALLIVLIGGRGTILGPIIGAIIVVILSTYISKYFSLHLLVLGIIMCAVVLWAPKGIVKYLKGLRHLP